MTRVEDWGYGSRASEAGLCTTNAAAELWAMPAIGCSVVGTLSAGARCFESEGPAPVSCWRFRRRSLFAFFLVGCACSCAGGGVGPRGDGTVCEGCASSPIGVSVAKFLPLGGVSGRVTAMHGCCGGLIAIVSLGRLFVSWPPRDVMASFGF